jgi:hypothetical protein
MKDLGDTVIWSQIQLACVVITDHYNNDGACMKEADGQHHGWGWKNYRMVDAHMHVAALFFK